MTFEDERLDRWLIASVLLHGAVFTLVIFSPRFFPSLGPNWGAQAGGAVGTSVKVVSSVSGVPLPTPEVVQENAPANESPGLYKTEPAPPAPPDKTAELIPDNKASVKPPPKAPPKPPAAKSAVAAPPTPSNAIPYGQGGRPD